MNKEIIENVIALVKKSDAINDSMIEFFRKAGKEHLLAEHITSKGEHLQMLQELNSMKEGYN
jgi:hypothetical protein